MSDLIGVGVGAPPSKRPKRQAKGVRADANNQLDSYGNGSTPWMKNTFESNEGSQQRLEDFDQDKSTVFKGDHALQSGSHGSYPAFDFDDLDALAHSNRAATQDGPDPLQRLQH